MYYYFAVLLVALLPLVGGSAEPSVASGKADVFEAIPDGQNIAVKFELAALRDTPLFGEPLREAEQTVTRDLEQQKMVRVANVLGLKMENIHVTCMTGIIPDASLSAGMDTATNRILVIGFRQPVELSRILRLTSENEGASAFETELMNGRLVFYHNARKLLVYQASPTIILIGGRNVIRKSTRKAQGRTPAGNDPLQALMTSEQSNAKISGAVLARGSGVLYDSIRFHLSNTEPETLTVVYVMPSKAAATKLVDRLKMAETMTSSDIRKEYSGAWNITSQTDRVTLTLPLNQHTASRLTQIIVGNFGIINTLTQLAKPDNGKRGRE